MPEPSKAEGHLGEAQYSQLKQGPDRLLGELFDATQITSPIAGGLVELMGDSLTAATAELLRFNHEPPPVVNGRVVESLPFVGWYKVQVDRYDIALRCCLSVPGSYHPTGVCPSISVPIGSDVIVWRVANTNRGVIIGVIPFESYKSDFVRPDFIQQGGNSGFKREPCHYQNIKIFAEEGTVQDFSSGRPMDQTSNGEFGQFNMHGGGIFLDDFQFYLRISEICGVFGNWFDQHLRVAGLNYDLQTAAHNEMSRLDEAETQFERGYAVYPWEGYGAYKPGTKFWKEHDDVDVQYKKPVGKIDEKGSDEIIEILPVYRVKEYGGYFGQGGRRIVMRPRKLEPPDVEKLSTTCPPEPPEFGLFEENVGLDGQYFLRSSKGIHLVKRLPGPHPKRTKMPEDQEEGKNDNKDNYKFSGLVGGGEEHKIGDLDNKGEELLSLKQCAGAIDLHTYIYNFKNLHPFHYHTKDYQTPEEEHQKPHDAVTDKLDFDTLASQMYMKDPESEETSIKIDHRYNDGEKVKYYKRESYFSMMDDGAVVLGCGYGAEIRMVYGHLMLSAPGDIWLQAGRSIRTWAGDDIDIRAKNSIDVVATEKDIRLKAEKNMELLAANGGTGGTIIENRANDKMHDYPVDKPGEDVVGSGILLRAPKSQLFSYSSEVYFRTGSQDAMIGESDIVFDSSKGSSAITMIARDVNTFVPPTGSVAFWFGTTSSGRFSVQKADCFSLRANFFGSAFAAPQQGGGIVQHIFGGNICAVGPGNMLLENNLTLVEGTGTHRGPSDKWGVLQTNPQSQETQRQIVRDCKIFLRDHFELGEARWSLLVHVPFHDTKQIGSLEAQQSIMCSLRDDDGIQYNSTDFKLAETRWQLLARLGIGAAGSTWTEKAVTYQGKELYPYPGKKKWVDEKTYLQLKELTMFDAAERRSKKRRKSPTETAEEYIKREIEIWKDPKSPPQGTYQTIT